MDAFLSHPTAHSHAPKPEQVPAIQLKREIKARAATTDESSSTILHSALRVYPLSAAGELQEMTHLCSRSDVNEKLKNSITMDVYQKN